MNLFIFGPQRTGSTLLHRLLESHPEIDSTPNDMNLLSIYSSGISDTPKWRQWELDNNDVETLMKLRQHDFLRNILAHYFKETYSRYKLHKTCKGEFDLRTYQRAFGGRVKFIYILRNPAAIMASRKYWEQPYKKNKWVDLTSKGLNFTDVHESFGCIKQHLGLVFKSIDIIDQVADSKDTLAIVNYEQLVNNPTRVLGELSTKLGLRSKGFSLTDGSCRKPIDPYTSHKELERRGGIYSNAIDIWKKKLTRLEIQLLYSEMIKFHEREFNSKFVSSLFSTYIDVVRRVVDEE